MASSVREWPEKSCPCSLKDWEPRTKMFLSTTFSERMLCRYFEVWNVKHERKERDNCTFVEIVDPLTHFLDLCLSIHAVFSVKRFSLDFLCKKFSFVFLCKKFSF